MLQSNSQKVLSLLMLFMLALTGSMEVKAQPSEWRGMTYNDDVRYSQWIINSRINDFYANSTHVSFGKYSAKGVEEEAPIIVVKNKKTVLDYVPGLVAKAIVENVKLNATYTWAAPWYYSMKSFGDTYYNAVTNNGTSGKSQDDLNGIKMFFALKDLTASGAKYENSTTNGHCISVMGDARTGLNNLNKNYIIGGANSGVSEDDAKALGMYGGWFHKSDYKDQMWCDGLYMGPALLAQLINEYGDYEKINGNAGEDDWDLITRLFTISWNQLYDSKTGLLYHAFTANPKDDASAYWEGISNTDPKVYHSAAFWGRACGWYFLALVDILEQMDKAGKSGTTNYTTLKGYLNSLAAGLANYQDATTGCWYQVLDEKDSPLSGNYLESSCTAIFAAAYLKGTRLGYFTTDYSTVAKNAYKGCVNQFMMFDNNDEAQLIHCCASAGLGGSAHRSGSRSYYISGSDVTQRNTYTEGKVLGGFILAATEYERMYQSNKAILFSTDLKDNYSLENSGTISIEAFGADGANITYQWYKDDVAVEGATNATITPTASGAYYCKATSGTTTITSSTAQVAVAGDDTFTPEFTTNLPATATATEGVAKTLTVAADHVDGYQWYSNTTASNTGGQAINGATEASYTFTPAATGTLYYYCVATNSKATGTQSVASAVCTVTVSEAPEMWTAAGATYNSTSKGYEVEGRGTYYKATSGGEATSSTDNDATWAAGTYRLKTSDNLFIYSLANSVSGLKVYMCGSGNRTLSSVATASSLNGSYSTLTNNTDYTYSSTCPNTSYITTSSTYDVVTFSFTSALAAGTFVKITLSGNAYIYGIEPVIASQKTENTLALSTESGEVTVGNTLDIKGYITNKNNTETEVTYTSNNTSVATVENGVITGVAEGTTTITVAQAETEEYTAGSATFTITVNAVPVTNYTVTFYNGSQYAIQTIEKGKTVTAPAISPTKQGYTFKGWALENGSTARVLFPYEVWSDVNFYAVWSENTGGGSGKDVEIFSATATVALSVDGGASNLEITSSNADISGGKMYVYNGQSSNIGLITTQKSPTCFVETNNNTFFKVVLDKALAVGDKIKADIIGAKNSATRGLWLTTATSRPESAPTATLSVTNSTSSDAWMTSSDYVVKENDGICGQKTFYIYRATGNSTYFTNFTIIREGQVIGDDITLDAASDYENFDDYVGEGKNVTLRRSFTEGKWTTLVLPFRVTTEQLVAAFDNADECELAKIKSMSVAQGKGSIHYTTVSSIEANKPVLAKIKPNASGEYVFNGVKVVAPTSVVSTSTDGKVEMHGVYKTTGYTQISSDSYFLSGGKFYDWSYLSNMSPFSAYILPVGENAHSVQYISFDDEATGIVNVNGNGNVNGNANGNGNANENESYNLAGQRVTKEYNGIVIIKGKKVFTK